MISLAQTAPGRFLVKAQRSYLWRNGYFRRRKYAEKMADIARQPQNWAPPVNAVVYSYVNEHDVPEQVVSLRSFLRFVGVPSEFVVVSDGTLTQKSKEIIESNHPCVRCSDGHELEKALGEEFLAPFRRVLEGNLFWRKFQVIAFLTQRDGVGVYADSDILFFPGAQKNGGNFCQYAPGNLWYLPDIPNETEGGKYYDGPLIAHESEREKATNAGFGVFAKRADWSKVAQRVETYEQEANFFTEQTLVHLMMRFNEAKPLDPQRHVLTFSDVETWGDEVHRREDVVLRHYVRVCRHRFWRHNADFYR